MRNLYRLTCVAFVAIALAAAMHRSGMSLSIAVNSRAATAAEAELQPSLSAKRQPQNSKPASRKGINAGDLRRLSAGALSAAVDDLAALGVSWVRMDFPWSEIESTRGEFNMRGSDAAVRALGSRGIGVLGIIDYAPAWANGGNGQMYPPTSATDFATYAAFLVRHFAPMGVHTWEIWNEPNLKVYWATGADPGRYTQLLKAAYLPSRPRIPVQS
jgi:hypothetical protein